MDKILKRTNMCGDLRKEDIGKEVVLNGWVQTKRNLGGLTFVDLRDKTGITQIQFADALQEKANTLGREYCIGVQGTVIERESKNDKLATGFIEVKATDLVIYSEADTPPS